MTGETSMIGATIVIAGMAGATGVLGCLGNRGNRAIVYMPCFVSKIQLENC